MKLTEPLRVRDYRLLFAGVSVSLVGDGIYTVALAFQVYALTNSPSALSGVLLCWSLGLVVASLGAGVVLDRADRRMVIVVADAAQMAAVAALGALSLAGVLEVWHCALLSSVVGAGTAFVRPAITTITPSLVPAELVVAATSLYTSVNRAAFLLAGPALGGLLVGALGPGRAFLVDAATFAVSIAAVLRMRTAGTPPARLRGSALGDLREGLGYVRRTPWIWGMLAGASVAILCFIGAGRGGASLRGEERLRRRSRGVRPPARRSADSPGCSPRSPSASAACRRVRSR